MRGGAVTLGNLAGKITLREIACSRCEGRGRQAAHERRQEPVSIRNRALPLRVSCGMSDDDESPLEWLVERVGSDSGRRQERIVRYRRHAAEIRARAATVTDTATRRQLLEIADLYEALARSIERLGSRGN